MQLNLVLPPVKPSVQQSQVSQPRQGETQMAVAGIAVENHSLDLRAMIDHVLEDLLGDVDFLETEVREAGEGRPSGRRNC